MTNCLNLEYENVVSICVPKVEAMKMCSLLLPCYSNSAHCKLVQVKVDWSAWSFFLFSLPLSSTLLCPTVIDNLTLTRPRGSMYDLHTKLKISMNPTKSWAIIYIYLGIWYFIYSYYTILIWNIDDQKTKCVLTSKDTHARVTEPKSSNLAINENPMITVGTRSYHSR